MSNNAVTGANEADSGGSHWEQWHGAYEDPSSPLSERLRLVQKMVRGALDESCSGVIEGVIRPAIRRSSRSSRSRGIRGIRGSPFGSSACAPARGET